MGEKAKRAKRKDNLPKCNESSCFACDRGRCVALNNNDFGERKCPFYKPANREVKA